MKIIFEKFLLKEIWENRETDFVELMKIVVDVEKGIMAVDGEMHADLEKILLENGSLQENLWGANIYPGNDDESFIEYTSFINIRPSQNNRSMEIIDESIREEVKKIVYDLLIK